VVLSDGVVCGKRWFHADHLVCFVCGRKIFLSTAIIHHGKFSCIDHGGIYAHSCEYCKELICGSETQQLGWNKKRYHPECFVCRVCGVKLQTSAAKRFHNRPHCLKCYQLRMGERRAGGDAVRRHTPGGSAERRRRFREGGVDIVCEPKYRPADDPVVEKVQGNVDAQSFQPQIARK
jgi:hypothetical protein